MLANGGHRHQNVVILVFMKLMKFIKLFDKYMITVKNACEY